MNHILPTATSPDVASRASRVAVLPVGSYEQHCDYLPLATDTLIACLIAREVAETHRLLPLPPITISCSHEHAGWPGTVSISAATLHAVITDVARSLAAAGTDRLLLVSAHGGNYVLSNIVQEASVAGPRMALFPAAPDWAAARRAAGMQTDAHTDMHAGELETSILLHALPDIVRPSYADHDHEASSRPHLLSLGMRAYTASGVIGRPSLATAEKGRAALDHLTAAAAAHLDVLLGDAGPATRFQ